jgi:hypothetical protein
MGNPLSNCGGDVLLAENYQELVIERVKRAWRLCPSLRLGQFISNALFNTDMTTVDVFYVDDVKMVEACEAYAMEHAARVVESV